MTDWTEQLERAIGDTPPLPPAGDAVRAGRSLRRRRTAAQVAGVAAVGVVGALGWQQLAAGPGPDLAASPPTSAAPVAGPDSGSKSRSATAGDLRIGDKDTVLIVEGKPLERLQKLSVLLGGSQIPTECTLGKKISGQGQKFWTAAEATCGGEEAWVFFLEERLAKVSRPGADLQAWAERIAASEAE